MEGKIFGAWIRDFTAENPQNRTARLWLEDRFLVQLDICRALEHRWRLIFWYTRYVILSGSLALPVIITAGKSISWLNTASILVSVVVALATAVEILLRSGHKWRLYRQAADKISTEGTSFFQMIDPYTDRDPNKRLHAFAENVEKDIEEFHKSYSADVDAVVSQNVRS